MAFVASVIWYLADRYAGDHYSAPFYGYWNTGMHFTTFLINAVAFAKIKSSLDQRHELERALVETREHVTQLTGLSPLSPQSHKPYVPDLCPRRRKTARLLRRWRPYRLPPATIAANGQFRANLLFPIKAMLARR